MTGHVSREIVAAPETRQGIEAGQVFAWNPSLWSAKAEETSYSPGKGPRS